MAILPSLRVLALLPSLLLPAVSFAQNMGAGDAVLLDSKQPLELSADSLDYDYETGRSIYTGNVEIRNGNMFFSGDRAELVLKDNELQHFRLEGVPGVMRNEAPEDKIHVRAKIMNYDNAKDVVHLYEQVWVHYNGNTFRGDYVIYDLKRKLVRAPKQQNKGRVRLTIQPKK